MQSASTKTFSVNFPDDYVNIRPAWESIRGEHLKEGEDFPSFAGVGLQENSFYDKYKGSDLLERFRAGCMEQRGDVDLVEDKTLPVAGLTSHIRMVKSDEFFYYFGIVPINSAYSYTFTGDCNLGNEDMYIPRFDTIWQSLQYFGNQNAEMDAQKAAIDALFGGNDDEDEETADKEPVEAFEIPADDSESWQLGDFTIHIIPAENPVQISDGDGALYIRIDGEMPDYSDDRHGHLLNDYEDGKVYLQFYFKGIYRDGVPTGTFTFEKERDNTYRSYLWKGGFHYALDLDATVTLKDGWLGIRGHFNNYPVSIDKRIPLDNLDWTKYRFLDPEELETAPNDIVRHIFLSDPNPEQLHETLQPFNQVETLSIFFKHDNQLANDVKEVPKPVKKYKQLRELTLTHLRGMDSLPQWIGDLKELETIHITGSQIAGIHPYIFQLPKLKYCYLSDNRLGSIHSNLPDTLETLSLENNQLTTVPASLAKLKRVNLKQNPLEQLPAGLVDVPDLDLELEKKTALLDYTYKGANGKGTVEFDDTIFFIKDDLKPRLHAVIDELELQPYRDGLTKLARKSIGFTTTEEDTYNEMGNLRFGGLPDLPADIPYPSFTDRHGQEKGLQFIAQLDCAAISHLQDYLPRTGMLYFFIKDQEDIDPKVIYYNGDPLALQSAKKLDITAAFIYDEAGIYTPFKAQAENYVSVPFFYNAEDYYKHIAPELAPLEEMYEETEAMTFALRPDDVAHSINSYVFKQHDTPEIEASQAFKGKPEDWMVLLRISSDRNTGFSFWDAGEIYFVIHKSDLAQGDFSQVYCGLESS